MTPQSPPPAVDPIPATITTLGPLAHLLDDPRLDAFDARVDAWAEVLRGNPLADRVFYGLSTLGDHGIIWHAIALGRVVVGPDDLVDALELSSALGIEAAIVNGPVKMLFKRVRPVAITERPRHLRTPRTSSFPSGHASAGMFAATLLAHRGRGGFAWYTLGLAIGWSRVHVRIHHPSDIVGGTIVGWLLGRAALVLLPKMSYRRRA